MGNIVLVGMPGVGKSTIGVILAKFAGYHFLDSDLLIQETTGKLLREIIAEQGVEGFIKVEEEVNSQIEAENTIVATGGSVVYGAKAMEHLSSIGTVVYLKLECEELEKRLGDLEKRGVVLKNGQTFRDLYNEREPLYEKYAHIVVDEKNKSAEDVVREIMTILK